MLSRKANVIVLHMYIITLYIDVLAEYRLDCGLPESHGAMPCHAMPSIGDPQVHFMYRLAAVT